MLLRPNLLIAIVPFAFAASLWAAPPSAEAMAEKIAQLYEYQDTLKPDDPGAVAALGRFASTLLADVDVEALCIADIQELIDLFVFAAPERARAEARLAVLAQSPDADGVLAAMTRTLLELQGDGDAADFGASIGRVLNHPARDAVLRTDGGGLLIELLAAMPLDALRPHMASVLAVGRQFDATTPSGPLLAARGYVAALLTMGELVTADEREALRVRIVALMADRAREERSGGDPQLADWLERSVVFLEGAAMRGRLLDHPAPDVRFAWMQGGTPVPDLATFRGRIVVLDFWATWCGPCVASFPEMRSLAERYAGYDVIVLGVTSLQGRHFPGAGVAPIVTEGDPAREYALMASYMTAMNITWPMAFMDADVFHPDFGVEGIPHLAVIDAKGVVRFNGLHPAQPLAEKAAIIDRLLQHGGLPAPAELTDLD